ncbi:MAG: hypothetical protein NC548_12890 [Lachnospiraceae bacterium]|nr:hypothetical protein [Lachnospiraceae bacterium]MCM1230713.1 hypothetical protein [Ruminococcus flavefaciens]
MSEESMKQEQEKIFLCKYKIPTCVLMLGEEKVELDHSNILNVEYCCDYEVNIRAILKMTLRLDIRRKLWLLKNKRDIVCKFELTKIGIDTDLEEYVTGDEPVWNLEFGIYLNDEEEASDANALEERLKLNDEDHPDVDYVEEENYFETQNMVDIFLFNQTLLNASNKTYNEVYTEDILQQAVARLLTQTKHKNVLMSPIENGDTYKELLIPGLPAYKGLIYLDQYYGLYKKGAIIFYDLEWLYIINPNGKLTAKREDEWPETVFLVDTIEQAVPGNGMTRKQDEKVFYINLSEADINPQKFSMTTNVAIGSEAKIVVSDGTEIEIEDADQSYIDQRNEYIQRVKKDDNKYAGEITKARMEENECILYISAQNLDVTAFSPNKTYKVTFTETSKQEKYGKNKYRLAYAYTMFRIESESYLSSSHMIILKKCSES